MRLALAAMVVAVALALAPAASSMIVIQRGMAGVAVGMTKSNVLATLGNPMRIRNSSNEFGTYTRFDYTNLTILFQGGLRVSTMRTTAPTERTAKGIGVGSTIAAVKAKVPNVKCRRQAGFRDCYVGTFKPGHIITDFQIKNGRVTQVLIGRVLD